MDRDPYSTESVSSPLKKYEARNLLRRKRVMAGKTKKTDSGTTEILRLLCLIMALLFGLVCLSGFSFSDPKKLRQEIRQEILKELEKIREKTPNAKKRAKWRKSRGEANDALLEARLYQASKYAPEEWDQAVALFRKAKEYAAKRSYLKADYLARQAAKYAHQATEKARAIIAKKEGTLRERYQKLKEELDSLSGRVPPDADSLQLRASELYLLLSDARLAMELRQFEDAEKGLEGAEEEINRFKRDLIAYLDTHPEPDPDMLSDSEEGQETGNWPGLDENVNDPDPDGRGGRIRTE
jgi:hypothetical protein